MRSRLTITLQEALLTKVDSIIDGVKIRNRSHAIEYLLKKAIYTDRTQALLLTGGEGVRLRPLTYELPKSLLPISGKPLIEYQLHQLRKANVRDVIVSINEKGEKIKADLKNGARFDLNLEYSLEKEHLGTGGAILKAKKHLKTSPFLVVYGDIYTEIDYQELVSFHQQIGSVVTIAIKSVDKTREFGQLALKGNKVTEWFSKPSDKRSNLINSGIYVCNLDIFKFFPQKEKFSFEEVLGSLVKQKRVSGYVFDNPWFDVGTLDDYEKVIKAARKLN